MKLIHTSDWHLGKKLHRQNRYEEFSQFLDWMALQIEEQQADVLLISGDIFDTVTPGNSSLEQYYRFLTRVSLSGCSNIVITAGNHDSPSLLNAPRGLMQALNIYVVGAASVDNPSEEVLVLKDKEGSAAAIVCAVPYLRDREIRSVEAGEGPEDRDRKIAEGIAEHYTCVYKEACNRKKEIGTDLPIVVMGHLFTAGAIRSEDDGVRDLYIGTLGYVSVAAFHKDIDYLALGHLHTPQKVGGNDHMRYSGSPLPMSFGEANANKQIVAVSWNGGRCSVEEIPVPVFQRMERVSGSLSQIENKINELKMLNESIWIEVEYTGKELVSDLSEKVNSYADNSELQILLVKNRSRFDAVLRQTVVSESLEDFNEVDVFTKFMELNEIATEEQPDLMKTYKEALHLVCISEKDVNA
ncbi:MAG: exonuclease SbcCD subunit D C-terminal domain-containing protein [Spirochaetes bacterium]|nr:exonuclease SbcCD subunit D C-terminal domain-containing protein [Spirochaetota bacterium]